MAREHYETLQQVFDDAYTGIAAQGFERSVCLSESGEITGCAYRGSNGRKCALGHCIPDSRYTSALEGYVGFDLPNNLPGLFSENISTHALTYLQSAHDRSVSIGLMKSELAAFAHLEGLTIPALSKAEGRSLSSASGQEGGK